VPDQGDHKRNLGKTRAPQQKTKVLREISNGEDEKRGGRRYVRIKDKEGAKLFSEKKASE